MQRPASSTSSLLTMGGGTNNSSSLRVANNNNSPARVATAPSGPGQSGNKSGRNVDFNLSFQQNKKPHSTKQGNNHSRPSGMSSLKNSSAMGLGGASLSLNNTMTDLHDNLSFFTDDENRTLDGSFATLEQNHTIILSKNVPTPESRSWGTRNTSREVLGVKHDKFVSVLWRSLASTAATQIHLLILFRALQSPKHD